MRKYTRAVMVIALAVVAGLLSGRAEAATYYWDTDGNTNGFGNTAGTWGTSDFWSSDSTGASGTASTTITTNDGVNFGTDTLAIGSAAAVGVSGVVSVNSITFGSAQATAVTLSGGTSITLGGTSPAITVNNASNTISSVLAGSSFTKAGNGTLTLSGANTHSGTTTISQGTLMLQGNAFVTTPRTYQINSGAVLDLGGQAVATGTTTIQGTGTLRISGGGISSGDDGRDLNINLGVGSTIDIVSGSQLYNGGWMNIFWTNNKAKLNVDGSLNIVDGNAVTADALTGAGDVGSSFTGGSVTLTVGNSNGSGTFRGRIMHGMSTGTRTIALTKTGTGTQTLSGTNSYSGTTTIGNGALAIAHNNALGNTTGNTTITANGSNSGPQLRLSGNITSPENISINGTTETSNYADVISNTSGTNTLSGIITLASPSGGIRIGSGGGLLTFSGTISQTGTARSLALRAAPGAALTVNNAIANNGGSLSVINPGAVTLKSVSTAIGATLISEGGFLKLGVNNAINTNQNLTIGAPWNFTGSDQGTFDLAGFNQTVTALISTTNTTNVGANSTRKVTNSAATGTSTLTVNGSGTNTFNGVILDGATAKVALTKTGTGMLTLAGNCTYSGDTVVENGTLRITGTNVLSSLTRVKLGTVPQTGTIDLAFTGTNMIKALYINGVKQADGTTFGANGTTITGTGFLRTAPGGTMILIR